MSAGTAAYVGEDDIARINVTDLHKLIRSIPVPVIALVAGWSIGGGHVLHVICDLTIAAENARFGQTGPRVGSFDGGFGAGQLARLVGQKKAREIWYLCRQYDAREALEMGLVNAVVPLDRLEEEGVAWGREILRHSPLALRLMKSSFNAELDGMAGITELAHNATLLFYMSEEGKEGRKRFHREARARLFGHGQVPPTPMTPAPPIASVRWRPWRIPLREPIATAAGDLTGREGLIVRIETADGAGLGESAPLPGRGAERFRPCDPRGRGRPDPRGPHGG